MRIANTRFEQVRDTLLAEIKKGLYQKDLKLPSESELIGRLARRNGYEIVRIFKNAETPVVLLDSAELTPGTIYETGRSSGFVRLPSVKTEQTKSVTAKLKLVPQGDVTLAELLEGFTAAGYAATEIAETDYNVALDVPVSLIRDRSADERLAFDFTSYATPDDLKSGTPTVRALVQRATIEKMGLGMMIILR